jgi:hypothetical protein
MESPFSFRIASRSSANRKLEQRGASVLAIAAPIDGLPVIQQQSEKGPIRFSKFPTFFSQINYEDEFVQACHVQVALHCISWAAISARIPIY